MLALSSLTPPRTRCCCCCHPTPASRSATTQLLQQAGPARGGYGQPQGQAPAHTQAAAGGTELVTAAGTTQYLQPSSSLPRPLHTQPRQPADGLCEHQAGAQQQSLQAEGISSVQHNQRHEHSQQVQGMHGSQVQLQQRQQGWQPVQQQSVQQQSVQQQSAQQSAQQQWQWQQHVVEQTGQLQSRPMHAQHHVQQMAQLVLACEDVLQLQAVLSIHLPQFTPSCMVTAMQQLCRLRRQQLQRHPSAGGGAVPMLQSVQLQLAVQLSQAVLRQLPIVSGSCLAAFLAAAASMRLVVPGAVLEQMAQHLVHKALRLACQQHRQWHAQTPAAGQQQPSSAPQQQQQQQQQQDVHSRQGTANTQGQSWHPVALSAWALAKLRLQSGPLWEELVSIAAEQMLQLAPQDCVVLAWACAKAGQHQPRVFYALQQQLLPHVQRLSSDCISSLLWSYAAAGQYHHSWLSALSSAAADSLERFTPRQLATSLWACARFRHADPRMLSAARVQALACLPDMQPQSVANLAWSLATLGCADTGLVAAVVNRAMDVVDQLSTQGLSNVAWAVVKLQQQLRHDAAAQLSFASSGLAGRSRQDSSTGADVDQLSQQQLLHMCRGLLQAIGTAATDQMTAARPQEVCNLLWACAKLKQRHEPCLVAAAARLAAVAEDACPLDLAQALWALETLCFRRSDTQRALLLPAMSQLHLFGPQALSNLAWAVASSGMRFPAALPGAVAQQLQALLPQMTPQGLSTTLWALSKLGPVPAQLIHTASGHIRKQLHLYNAQDLCNVAMVTAKAGYKQPQLLHALAAAASSAAAATLAAATPTAAVESHHSNGLNGGDVWTSQQVPVGVSGMVQSCMRLTGLGVCNLVWAFAGVGWCCPHTLQQLQQVAVLHLPNLPPRNIAGLLQGFALLGAPIHQLLAAFLAQQQVRQGSGMHQGRTAQQDSQRTYVQGPAADLGVVRGESVLVQVQRCTQLLRGWPVDSLALLLHAVAVADAQDEHVALVLAVLRCLSRRCASEPLSAPRQQQLHTALTWLSLHWGLAIASLAQLPSSTATPSSTFSGQGSSSSSSLQQQPTPHVPAGLQQVLSDALTTDASGVGCGPHPEPIQQQVQQQEHQGLTHQHPPPPGLPALRPLPSCCSGEVQALASGLLTGGLSRQCTRAWQQHEASRQLTVVEQEVVTVLRGMGLTPCKQHWVTLTHTRCGGSHTAAAAAATTSSTALAVRLGLPASVLGLGRRPVAMCVLPQKSAFSSSLPRRVLGASCLEHRCLAAAGWQVVTLSKEQWKAAGASQREELLRQLCGL